MVNELIISYPVVLKKANECYLIEFPDFEGIFTESENLELSKALKEAVGVLGDVAGAMLEFGRLLPEASSVEEVSGRFDGEDVIVEMISTEIRQ